MAVLGYDKLQKQLNNLANLDTRLASIKMAQKVFQESQTLVPVDKGDLKASGKVVEQGEGATVVYDSDHSAYVEFGTIKMKAQPYLRPAYENNINELTRIGAEEIQREIREAIR